MDDAPLILWLSDIGRKDGDKVGGKNASLGEMIGSLRAEGVRVPRRLRHHCRGVLAVHRCQRAAREDLGSARQAQRRPQQSRCRRQGHPQADRRRRLPLLVPPH